MQRLQTVIARVVGDAAISPYDSNTEKSQSLNSCKVFQSCKDIVAKILLYFPLKLSVSVPYPFLYSSLTALSPAFVNRFTGGIKPSSHCCVSNFYLLTVTFFPSLCT